MIEASELLTPECVASANSSEKYEKYEKYEKKKCNCAEGKLYSVAFVKRHDMAIIQGGGAGETHGLSCETLRAFQN